MEIFIIFELCDSLIIIIIIIIIILIANNDEIP